MDVLFCWNNELRSKSINRVAAGYLSERLEKLYWHKGCNFYPSFFGKTQLIHPRIIQKNKCMGGKKMNVLESNFDKRSECLSILVSMTLVEYKKITYPSFVVGGNLAGQRDVIKRSSVATKIRKRMNNDFIDGAIFPNVVIGLLLNDAEFEYLKQNKDKFIEQEFKEEGISIIDGMQRSNIYFSNYEGNEEREIRAEFWISNKSVKLLYRMLVLNTGQVPWNTRRQVEVIFANLSKTIIKNVFEKYSELTEKVEIIDVDDQKRRSQAGKFHKSTMIEMYLGFNTRKVKVDVSDELADEFQRFDMMEAIEQDINLYLFVDTFAYLCKLDLALSECSTTSENGQFKEGKDIFGSVPACLGFIVACAEYIMGKIPVERDEEVKTEKNIKLKLQIDKIIGKSVKEVDFLALDSLNDVIDQLPKARIGEEMRIMFKTIFSELLKYDEIEEISSLEAFWRS